MALARGDAAGAGPRYAFAVVGERNSGTTWVAKLLRENARVSTLRPARDNWVRWKHGFVGAAELDAYFGAARDAGAAGAAPPRLLVVVVVKSPLAWVASMCDSPYHADAAAPATGAPSASGRRGAVRPRRVRRGAVALAPQRRALPGAGAPNISEVSRRRSRSARPSCATTPCGCASTRRRGERARDGARAAACAVAVVEPTSARCARRARSSSPRSRARCATRGAAPTRPRRSRSACCCPKPPRSPTAATGAFAQYYWRIRASGSVGDVDERFARREYYLERRYLERFSTALGCAVVGELDLDLERGLGFELPPAGWDCSRS